MTMLTFCQEVHVDKLDLTGQAHLPRYHYDNLA